VTPPVSAPLFNAGHPAPDRLLIVTRFMLPDGFEHACRMTGLSSSGALLLNGLDVAPGVPLVCYAEGLGRIAAEAGERTARGLPIRFALKGARLTRFEAQLRLLARAPHQAEEAQARRHARFVPASPSAQLTIDGRSYPCEIIDISLSGAAVRSSFRPGLGALMLLGKTRGRVVRYLADGFAIEFVRPIERAQLRRTLA